MQWRLEREGEGEGEKERERGGGGFKSTKALQKMQTQIVKHRYIKQRFCIAPHTIVIQHFHSTYCSWLHLNVLFNSMHIQTHTAYVLTVARYCSVWAPLERASPSDVKKEYKINANQHQWGESSNMGHLQWLPWLPCMMLYVLTYLHMYTTSSVTA